MKTRTIFLSRIKQHPFYVLTGMENITDRMLLPYSVHVFHGIAFKHSYSLLNLACVMVYQVFVYHQPNSILWYNLQWLQFTQSHAFHFTVKQSPRRVCTNTTNFILREQKVNTFNGELFTRLYTALTFPLFTPTDAFPSAPIPFSIPTLALADRYH